MAGEAENLCAPHTGETPPTCPICDQIIEFYRYATGRGDNLVLGIASSLIDTKCPHGGWFNRFVPSSLKAKFPVEIYISKSGSSVLFRRRSDAGNAFLGRYELVYREGTGLGRGRILDPSWIDERDILNWKDLCDQHHGDACEDPVGLGRLDPATPTWLIDTMDGCLVPGRREMRYVALSYVHGEIALPYHEKRITSQLQEPRVLIEGELAERLPRTVRDAIALVPRLGERFLWADLLCIVHDDVDSLQTELDAIGRIYKSSCMYSTSAPLYFVFLLL